MNNNTVTRVAAFVWDIVNLVMRDYGLKSDLSYWNIDVHQR